MAKGQKHQLQAQTDAKYRVVDSLGPHFLDVPEHFGKPRSDNSCSLSIIAVTVQTRKGSTGQQHSMRSLQQILKRPFIDIMWDWYAACPSYLKPLNIAIRHIGWRLIVQLHSDILCWSAEYKYDWLLSFKRGSRLNFRRSQQFNGSFCCDIVDGLVDVGRSEGAKGHWR